MKRYWYVLDINPTPWKVGPVGAARSAKTQKVKGYVGRDQELFSYQQAIREALGEQDPVFVEGKFRLTILFWRNMAEYATRQSETARNQEADGTNLYKATEDACQGILFKNDKDNVWGNFLVVDQGPDVEGRVVICIEPVTQEVELYAIDLMPDEVYARIYGTDGSQLKLAINGSKSSLEAGDDEYASAEAIF